jgi:hypothetical protein
VNWTYRRSANHSVPCRAYAWARPLTSLWLGYAPSAATAQPKLSRKSSYCAYSCGDGESGTARLRQNSGVHSGHRLWASALMQALSGSQSKASIVPEY